MLLFLGSAAEIDSSGFARGLLGVWRTDAKKMILAPFRQPYAAVRACEPKKCHKLRWINTLGKQQNSKERFETHARVEAPQGNLLNDPTHHTGSPHTNSAAPSDHLAVTRRPRAAGALQSPKKTAAYPPWPLRSTRAAGQRLGTCAS